MLAWTLLAAVFWALMEVQIEGPHGWAEKLPTWRLPKSRLLDFIYGGADITGYHLWAFTVTFVFFHFPFAGGAAWSWRVEGRVIGAYTFFWIVEDFLWFAFNPHYGWRAFRADRVTWHRRWAGGLPLNYWIMGVVGIFLYLLPVF